MSCFRPRNQLQIPQPRSINTMKYLRSILFFITALVHAGVWIPRQDWLRFYRIARNRNRRLNVLPRFTGSKSLNDMIAFSAIFYHDQNLSRYADKLEVRKFITQTIGDKYLSQILQVADGVDDLNLEEAVGHFVKTNHDSGGFFKFEKMSQEKSLKTKMNNHLSHKDYGVHKGEYMYRGIAPKVFVECLHTPPTGQSELKVWRIFFHFGSPLFIQVNQDSFSPDLTDVYNPDFVPICRYYSHNQGDAQIASEKPPSITSHATETTIKEILAIGQKCTAHFHFCRFDILNTQKGICFSEITFMPVSGCFNEALANELGCLALLHAPNFFKKA